MSQLKIAEVVGAELGSFKLVCPGPCGKKQHFKFQRILKIDGKLHHRYVCPEQKCSGTVDVQQKGGRK